MGRRAVFVIFFLLLLIRSLYLFGEIIDRLQRIELRFGEAKEEFFKNAADMEIYRDYLLIVDNVDHRIVEFAIKNNKLEFQRSIGRHGQGPGDLELPIRISTWSDILAVQDQQGISFFDLEGNYKTKFRIFSGSISFLFTNGTVFHAAINPTKSDLIEVYSMEGRRLYSFGEKKEIVDFNYNTMKGMSPTTVEMAIFSSVILSDGKHIYLLNRRFGTFSKFSMSGKRVFETTITSLFGENELSKVKENRRLFLENGYDFLKTRAIPQYYVFRSAKMLGDTIFFLMDQWNFLERKQNAFLEVKAINKDSPALKSIYRVSLNNDERFLSFDTKMENGAPVFLYCALQKKDIK
ncbi:MAG: hypothetical protein ACUVV5_09435 [Candidatus Aminicenantales bacterium]